MSAPDNPPLIPSDAAQSESPAILAPPPRHYPDDLQIPWGWNDLLIFMVFAIGAYLLLSVALIVVFFSRGVRFADLQHPGPMLSLFTVLDTAILSAALVGYLAVTTRVHFHKPFWRTLGWRPFDEGVSRALAYTSCILGGVLFAIVIGLASAAVGKKGQLPIERFFQDRTSIYMLMVVGILISPFVEETLFRGYLYPLLARSFGIAAGVIVTGTLFGLLHAGQLWGGPGQIALLIFVGIVFTYVRAFTHTVRASFILHLSYNSYLFAALFFTSSGFHRLPISH